MSNPKFTPGPWEYEGINGKVVSVINGIHAVVAHNGTFRHSAKESAANAHLIAAAPELYEALENIIRAIKMRTSIGNDLIHELIEGENALKKANP